MCVMHGKTKLYDKPITFFLHPTFMDFSESLVPTIIEHVYGAFQHYYAHPQLSINGNINHFMGTSVSLLEIR